MSDEIPSPVEAFDEYCLTADLDPTDRDAPYFEAFFAGYDAALDHVQEKVRSLWPNKPDPESWTVVPLSMDQQNSSIRAVQPADDDGTPDCHEGNLAANVAGGRNVACHPNCTGTVGGPGCDCTI